MKIKIIAIAMAALLSVAAATDSAAAPVVNNSSTTSSISELRKKRDEFAKQKKELNEKISAIEFEHMEEMEKKQILDERIALTGLEIDNMNQTIEQYKMLISEKEYEVIIAQNRENAQLDNYKARVRIMEENGTVTILDILFDSTSFMDLVARVDFINSVLIADDSAYEALQNARKETETAREELDIIKDELEDELEQLGILKIELDEQIEEAIALILKIEEDLESAQALYDMAAAEEERVQKEIARLEEQLRKQREAAAAAAAAAAAQQNSSGGSSGNSGGGSVTGTGELMWPVKGSVISQYGMRNGRMHQGVDIGAAHGTPIYAADSGTVITSSYGSGYGNYVVISHGNGITTTYAHNSSNSVKVGDTVSKGQQIGLVGSTGNATTPHLHFEVSVNGTRVNPLTKL